MNKPFVKILVLVNLLSIGRYFSYVFITTFTEPIMHNLHINVHDVLQLLEWYRWPNMILSVICGFLMDNLLDMKSSLIVFSSIAVFGHVLFISSFHVQSYWLCAASQLFLGVGYETILIIQLAFCGRNFIYGRIYSAVGVLFFICFASTFFGNLFLPLIYKGMGQNLVNTAAILLLPHLLSFCSAMWLAFSSNLDSSNPSEPYVLQNHFKTNLYILSTVLIFYYSPNLQFWADFKESLKWKYNDSDYITELFFGTTSIAMLIFGFLFDNTGKKIKHLLWGLIVLFLAHTILTFTFVSPWPVVFFVGLAHAVSQLVIWVFLFFILPKKEYATAMGFLQSFQNLTLAMSSHLKPIIMDSYGLFVQGIINIICMLIAFAGAVCLWYLN